MVRRFVFGNPIETEAVLEKPKAAQVYADKTDTANANVKGEDKAVVESGVSIPHLAWDGEALSLRMDEEDIVYGLGENVRGINKRGWIYVSNCSDIGDHHEDTHSLYGAHNFLLIDGKETFGLFIDTPAKVTFDVGYTKYDELRITVEDSAFELYVIEAAAGDVIGTLANVMYSGRDAGCEREEKAAGDDRGVRVELSGQEISIPEQIVREFRGLIGRSYIPPKWAFGVGQSRWSYPTAQDVREVARQYHEHHIPLDMIYLDIDYMERCKDFTIDREAFPDFEELVES